MIQVRQVERAMMKAVVSGEVKKKKNRKRSLELKSINYGMLISVAENFPGVNESESYE